MRNFVWNYSLVPKVDWFSKYIGTVPKREKTSRRYVEYEGQTLCLTWSFRVDT